ncbi:MAG: MbtH domain protein [Vicinamibacterales bacterium]
MDDLVRRLSEGQHDIEIVLRAGRTADALKACIDRRFVHVKFTGTRGGTELGVPLDMDRCDVDAADWERGAGRVHLEGPLTLNFVKVRCLADVDLASLAGNGCLAVVEDGGQTL